jgi:hypothetical protein
VSLDCKIVMARFAQDPRHPNPQQARGKPIEPATRRWWPFMIATFGNLTPVARVEFPKLAIMVCFIPPTGR